MEGRDSNSDIAFFSLGYTVSEDLKDLLQMFRKQTATSKHPCSFCMTSSPDFQKADHYTLESLCRLYNKWMADGAKLKKAKKYTKVVYPVLLIGDKNKQKTRTCKYSWSTYTTRSASYSLSNNIYLR